MITDQLVEIQSDKIKDADNFVVQTSMLSRLQSEFQYFLERYIVEQVDEVQKISLFDMSEVVNIIGDVIQTYINPIVVVSAQIAAHFNMPIDGKSPYAPFIGKPEIYGKPFEMYLEMAIPWDTPIFKVAERDDLEFLVYAEFSHEVKAQVLNKSKSNFTQYEVTIS